MSVQIVASAKPARSSGRCGAPLADEAWNLATCRAQEALELAITALLSEMTVDYPKIHDPARVFVHAVRARAIEVDAAVMDSLATLSQELASIRGPLSTKKRSSPRCRLATGSSASSARSIS
jgi:HEPN domain-containing protein